jgi:hypothetical protein
LYRYTSDQDTGEVDFSLLWPLADYKSRHGTVTSANLLWWLISYTHPDADHSAFQVFGGTKMAVISSLLTNCRIHRVSVPTGLAAGCDWGLLRDGGGGLPLFFALAPCPRPERGSLYT